MIETETAYFISLPTQGSKRTKARRDKINGEITLEVSTRLEGPTWSVPYHESILGWSTDSDFLLASLGINKGYQLTSVQYGSFQELSKLEVVA
jgi:hypothetical protein